MRSWKEETLALTEKLIHHPSVNGTVGERDIAYHLIDFFRELPYFQENPNQLYLWKTEGDDRERYNVAALVKSPEPKEETVILMGHMDTVGVEDYGKWKRLAFSPEELLKQWKKTTLTGQVKEDLATGKWLVGRGSVDMKSGVAVNMALLRHFAEHPEELDGNLLFLATCDEEDNSHGILSAVRELNHLATESDLRYVGAINTDYTSPQYKGDPSRYVYLGTVGKLLPAFFIVGEETHAGQAFEGFDPNLIAADLTYLIDYNPDFCDEMYGEVTMPPVSLKQTDLKQKYDVQTPFAAFSYYNFFVHSRSPKDVLQELKETASQALHNAIQMHQERYQRFCALSGSPYLPYPWTSEVMTYDELYEACVEKYGGEFKESMRFFGMNLLNDEALDLRQYCCRMVEEVWDWWGEKGPSIILFFASVYMPRVVLSEKEEQDQRLIQAVHKAVKDVQPQCSHPIQIRNFFPYISDMSFVAICDDEDGIEALTRNMPAWGLKHQMDVDAIRQLDVPVVNIGPYGIDAHKQWERVEIPYSMQVVPELIYQVVRGLLASWDDQ
ncbi:Arginine utilization protein RocB [Marininema mesophilum]|uniref:Arginine utilization protein RocB n=1 Tax=Marininema mesophilum TaxID=1048340 RepID=A0A1H2QTI0_9BACL|nr:M20/M25/M40 family metallo-hydrolase [Marininema mesophilum]SDW09759.1 Arginine utilization protein RocB [Marininema mesophilum]